MSSAAIEQDVNVIEACHVQPQGLKVLNRGCRN